MIHRISHLFQKQAFPLHPRMLGDLCGILGAKSRVWYRQIHHKFLDILPLLKEGLAMSYLELYLAALVPMQQGLRECLDWGQAQMPLFENTF